MACYHSPRDHDGSVTITVSPHRAGLNVAEANALLAAMDVPEVDAMLPRFKLFYCLTEIAETLTRPELHIPDPAPDRPIAYVETWGTGTPAHAALVLAAWETAYAKAVIHEPV